MESNKEKRLKCENCGETTIVPRREFISLKKPDIKAGRTFLGFYKMVCPKCDYKNIYHFSDGYRAFYIILIVIGGLSFLSALVSGNIVMPGIVFVLSLIALIKDNSIRRDMNQVKKTQENNNTKKNESEELERDYEFGGITGVKPRKETEARRVYEEAKKRKKIAEDKKVKELINDLYFNGIESYPSWIKTDREYVPSIVSKAIKKKERGTGNKREKDIIEITLDGKDYKFVFQKESSSTPDGEYHTRGLLELFFDDKKVLAINVSEEDFGKDYDFYSEWHPLGIEAFIDGDWIEDFQKLKRGKGQDDRERAIKEAEDPEKIEKLKRDFGI